jgi:hypothetical protein
MARFENINEDEFAARTLKTQPTLAAQSAKYDARRNEICIRLNNGISAAFPLDLMPELKAASSDDLRKIVVEGRGYGLHFPAIDADISVAQLFADHLGATGMLTRLKRSRASRKNGKLGGRPKKTEAA